MIPAGPVGAYLGTCRPVDWVGHVARSASVTDLDIAGLNPTAAFAVGFFLLVFSDSFLNSFLVSQCMKEHVSFVHFFAPPLSLGLHGLWKWQGLLPCQEPFELLDELLDFALEVSESRPGLAFFLYGHLLA